MRLRERLGPITVQRINTTLAEVVARKGLEHVAPSRMFDSDGQPSCLVGALLAAWGLTEYDIPGLNETKNVLEHLQACYQVDIEPAAAVYLLALQCHNDSRRAWGEAATSAWAVVEQHHRAKTSTICGCLSCVDTGYWSRLMDRFWFMPLPTEPVWPWVAFEAGMAEIEEQLRTTDLIPA